MKPHVQIVGRIPPELKRRLIAAAKRRRLSVNAYLIETLTQAVGAPRRTANAELTGTAAHVPAKDAVFFDQVGHGVLLPSVEPADQRDQE